MVSPAFRTIGLIGAMALTTLAGCGGGDTTEGDSTTFDAESGIDGVVACLADGGWTETGKATGTSGTSYTVDSDSGTSVLLSVESADTASVDETTFTVPAPEASGDTLQAENIIGTISDEERGQIEDCAGA